MKSTKYILFTLLGTFSACTEDVEMGNYIELPVRVSIPFEGSVSRAIGDPGDGETWVLPNKMSLYLCTSTDVNATNCETVTTAYIDLDPDSWQFDQTLTDKYTDTGKSQYANIYTYQGANAIVRVPENQKVGRVYVALERKSDDYFLSPSITYPTDENAVKELSFSFSGTGTSPKRNDWLKNLYSTPAGRSITDTENNTYYYGTVLDMASKVPHIDELICYHVAAKLDITWEVSSVNPLKTFAAQGLYSQNCSLFDPAKNAGVDTTNGLYSESFTTNTGNEWMGRKSWYVINSTQRTTMTFKLNDVKESIDVSTADYSSVFTPWIRVQLNINKTLPTVSGTP